MADRELNAWCSLRKTCQYQSELDEQNDVSVFKSKGNNFELKKKVLPSLFAEDPVCLTNRIDIDQLITIAKAPANIKVIIDNYLGLGQFDHINQIITLSVIVLSCINCI